MAFVKSSTTNLWKFDEDLFKALSVFESLLFRLGMTSFAPELADLFGREGMVRFMDVFSGTTFKVPDRKTLLDTVRDTIIYQTIEEQGEGAARDLAVRYQTTIDWIMKRHGQVQKFLENGSGYFDSKTTSSKAKATKRQAIKRRRDKAGS